MAPCLTALALLVGCATTSSRFLSEGDVFEQSGKIQFFGSGKAYNYTGKIHYPVPYRSPPHPTIDVDSKFYLKELKQTETDF